MRVAVTGSSGLIGSALVPALRDAGHEVVRLVRGATSGPDEIQWNPAAPSIDREAFQRARIEGVVNLAGEGIGEKRWNPEQKRKILDSRVQGTRLLAETFASMDEADRPRVFVSGSAVGYYGLRGGEVLTEESSGGTGFLADVARSWEAATKPAEDAGIRTVHLRTGIVLAAKGGALGKVLPLFRLGLGGRLGKGDQWWSWVWLGDEVGLILHALTNDSIRGPMNGTAPNPVTNRELTRTLGQLLNRPTVFAVPKPALSLVMGSGMTEEMILAGQRALPKVAEASGYTFQCPDIGSALRLVVKGS